MIRLVAFLTLILTFSVTHASGNIAGGVVAHVASVDESLLFSVIGGSATSRPTCASTGRFSVKKDSVHAPLVLMAFATGKAIRNVRGLGTCDQWGNSEDVYYVEVCPLSGC